MSEITDASKDLELTLITTRTAPARMSAQLINNSSVEAAGAIASYTWVLDSEGRIVGTDLNQDGDAGVGISVALAPGERTSISRPLSPLSTLSYCPVKGVPADSVLPLVGRFSIVTELMMVDPDSADPAPKWRVLSDPISVDFPVS